MTFTTLCLPKLPKQCPAPQSDGAVIASCEVLMLEPHLDRGAALAVDALCAVLLDDYGDDAHRQRHIAHAIRAAVLGQRQMPAWLWRRALLRPEKWVRDWAEKSMPLGPLAGGHVASK